MMRNIKDLHPRLQSLIEQLQAQCLAQGLKIGIGECLRTVSEQDELYAQGRTKKGKKVTNAKGSSYSSMHQWGIAFDFFRNDGKGAFENNDKFFEKVGRIGVSLGLEWGGNWKSIVDLPHFQLPDWGSTPKLLKSEYKVPERFFESWDSMTKQEIDKFNALVDQVEKLTHKVDELMNTVGKVYHYGEELPDWAEQTMQKLVDKGLYKGESESDLNLPETLMRGLVINDRAKLYDGR